MRTICFYFQIHQPFRLKRYRFFDIGSDHYYYDDFNNEEIIKDIARKSYIPANQAILEMIRKSDGRFKVAYSLSGVVLEQLQIYAPEFIDSMKELAATGCVEFLSETYSHSLASLVDVEGFERQVKMHDDMIEDLFGQKPRVIRNTELIYSDDIAEVISGMGYKAVITEGAKHILGWKSPNYVYSSACDPNLKLLLKNSKLSDDISFNFSKYDWCDYPLTADKFINWINALPEDEKVVNLFVNYETFGSMQPAGTGIFEFLKALPQFAEEHGITFSTPSEVVDMLPSAGTISVTHPISWADEERDTSAWLGNELQKEACNTLYSLSERIRLCNDRRLLQDWDYLQSSDHFYYMSTKRKSDGAMHKLFSPYDSPYEAFTNYMNVLSDFVMRVQQQYPTSIENEELSGFLTTIENQAKEINKLEERLERSKTMLDKLKAEKAAKSKEKEKKLKSLELKDKN